MFMFISVILIIGTSFNTCCATSRISVCRYNSWKSQTPEIQPEPMKVVLQQQDQNHGINKLIQ